MNCLNINLEEGQKVVMQGEGSESYRTVTLKGGYGMHTFTAGSALFAELSDGTPVKMDGMEIEKIVE
jgi:hypothetical protein